MRLFLAALHNAALASCGMPRTDQKTLQNATMREHAFLRDMYADDHYPQHVVDDRRAILVQLCRAIEQERPEKESQLYAITY